MLRILSTTALAATIAAPLLAASHVASESTMDSGATMNDDMAMQNMDNMIRTRDITGGPIYSIADRYDEATWMADDTMAYGYENDYGYGTDYAQIGEIEDIILDTSGNMTGIVAEVGGFLDIGDKHVMLSVDDVRLVAVDDRTYSYVTRLTEEQLEELPGVDEAWWN